MKIDEGTMARYVGLISESFIIFLLVAHLEQLVLHNREPVVEGVIEDRFEKCCGLGTSWAEEGLRCEKFIGPVPGVPAVEQGPCQKTVDICCVRKYHDLQCEKGKADARQGLPCVSNVTNTKRTKITSRSDYHRDCCEGCKLGIYAASMGQGCNFKTFSFGIPWDPAFLECCHENLPSTTTDLTSPSTTDIDSSSPSSPSSPYSSSSSSPYSSSPSLPMSSSLSSSSTSPSSSEYSSSMSSSESTPYSIPTPELDDICQLMKGMLCSDICVPTPGSYYCKCRDGFTLLEDGKTCSQDPTDRCKSTHPCEQICTDNGEAVICSCNPGYDLDDDGRSCIPKTTKNKKSTDAADKDNVSSLLCPSGYRYNVTKQVCDDIDECAEGLDTCGDEICYNQPGGYSCATPPAPITRKPSTTALPAPGNNQRCIDGTRYVRNRGCVDINECRELEDACSSNEVCINTVGSYICTCRTGFRRDNLTQACVDINECQLQQNDCLPTQRCDNTIGSYSCVRILACGTGYTLNAATEICEDDDECVLGTHDCGVGYQCRNTLGSYRCDRISRIPTPQSHTSPMSRATMMTTTTTTTTTTRPASLTPTDSRPSCPRGFESGSSGKCVDIDECQKTPNLCGRQNCINTLGSFRCVSRVICPPGYALDPITGQHCLDVDECREGIHECTKGQICENRLGGYHCLCPPGYVDGPNRDCVDIDECSVYSALICGRNSRCENTAGSFKCLCEEGFENNRGSGLCQDIDECERIPGLCQHMCLNVWGSYRCGCNAGFRLNADNRSCSDIDECTEFKDNNLCIGICENTPGSYACKCPDGYRLGTDGRTCQDIDECATGQVCRDPDETCHNTRGSYRCNRINCPAGYHRDTLKKNRCVRSLRSCPWGDLACIRSPLHYSYNFITFVSMLPIPNSGQLELFTMRGNHHPESTIQFTMALMDVRAAPGIARATESCFNLRKPSLSQAVLVLTRSIPGPQEIELDLSMEIYHESKFVGSAVAKIIIFVSQYEF